MLNVTDNPVLQMFVSTCLVPGVSTSGMTGKARGRVGDSALPGSGLYAGEL